MTNLLVLKEKIVGIYKNFEYPILMVGKFILAILAFQYVNEKLGYFEALTGIVSVLLLSVICAVVPVSIFVLSLAVVVLRNLFGSLYTDPSQRDRQKRRRRGSEGKKKSDKKKDNLEAKLGRDTVQEEEKEGRKQR